jgi:hypothetical protein
VRRSGEGIAGAPGVMHARHTILQKRGGCIGSWERDAPDLFFLGYGSLGEAARHAARINARLLFSAVCGTWTSHAQRELRTDLIGLYVYQRKALPLMQYGGAANRNAGNPWPLLEVGQ